MNIKKIKDWIKERVEAATTDPEHQFRFIHGGWVVRLSDNQSFKLDEFVCVKPESIYSSVMNTGRILSFSNDKIHVCVSQDKIPFITCQINNIIGVSNNLSYKKESLKK